MSNENDYNEDTDPLLVYCMSVIDSINDDDSKPNTPNRKSIHVFTKVSAKRFDDSFVLPGLVSRNDFET